MTGPPKGESRPVGGPALAKQLDITHPNSPRILNACVECQEHSASVGADLCRRCTLELVAITRSELHDIAAGALDLSSVEGRARARAHTEDPERHTAWRLQLRLITSASRAASRYRRLGAERPGRCACRGDC